MWEKTGGQTGDRCDKGDLRCGLDTWPTHSHTGGGEGRGGEGDGRRRGRDGRVRGE